MMRRLALAGLVLLGLGCGGDGGTPPPTPGDLVVTYFQGGMPAGAILLTISGGPVESIISRVPGVEVMSASPSGTVTKVILTGPLSTGDLLTIRVPDPTQFAAYSARTEQVADGQTFGLIDPAGYSFTIHR